MVIKIKYKYKSNIELLLIKINYKRNIELFLIILKLKVNNNDLFPMIIII